LGRKIEKGLRSKKIFWAEYVGKDPGKLTKEAIEDAIQNKKGKLQRYLQNLKKEVDK